MNTKVNHLKDNIESYIINHEQKLKDILYILFYMVVIFIILFSIAKGIKTKTNFYRDDLKFRWDNILSYDDICYARQIYSSDVNYEHNNVMPINVRHPLMKVWGMSFSNIEEILCKNLNKTDHYFHIVVFQIIINLIGTYYLYKILREQFELKNLWCFLLITIYQLATVTILGTLIIETFLLSSTLLIMSYYYLRKQKKIMSIIAGILLTGVTITNAIAFAIMAIFLLKDKKDIFKVGTGCILGCIIVLLILPYGSQSVSNLLAIADNNITRFAREQTGITYIKMIFYNLLSSPIFFIKQVHTVKNGLDFVTFDLSSSKIVAITTIIFFLLIIYDIVKNIKDRRLLAALGVFIYNMILHGIVKFGLYEGTIYGLHFLFTEILIFALGFKIENKKIRNVFIAFSIFMILVQLRYNIKGMIDILVLLPNWK